MKPPVDTAQTAWELTSLLDIVVERTPSSVLEVGIWEGGTLWHWLQVASRVVAIDDAMRPPGPDVWHEWADDADTELFLFQGHSRDAGVIDAVEGLGGYDMVFIDADHEYGSVAADFANYAPMLNPGGMVVLHDITPRPMYGVDRLWSEIKTQPGARTVEIVENSGRFNGIGVVWP